MLAKGRGLAPLHWNVARGTLWFLARRHGFLLVAHTRSSRHFCFCRLLGLASFSARSTAISSPLLCHCCRSRKRALAWRIGRHFETKDGAEFLQGHTIVVSILGGMYTWFLCGLLTVLYKPEDEIDKFACRCKQHRKMSIPFVAAELFRVLDQMAQHVIPWLQHCHLARRVAKCSCGKSAVH